MSDRDDQVQVFVEKLLRQTDRAAHCLIDGEKHWLPWSQIDSGSDISYDGDSGLVYIPRWIAEEKGIEYEEI